MIYFIQEVKERTKGENEMTNVLREAFNQLECTELGTFEVREGDQFILSDPSCDEEFQYFPYLTKQHPKATLIKTDTNVLLTRMKPGMYEIEFYAPEGRVESWIFKHQDVETYTNYERVVIAVDSGQVGLFLNDQAYQTEAVPEDIVDQLSHNKNWTGLHPWYAYMCETSASNQNINLFGICTSSGWGDGGYGATIFMNEANEVVAIEMIFVGYCKTCHQDWDDCQCDDTCPDCGMYYEDCICFNDEDDDMTFDC